MLTPEATETPIPLTGEVRPKIGPTAQTGTRAASDDAGRAGLAQRLRKGTRQCGHIRHSADPEGRTGRPSGECQIKGLAALQGRSVRSRRNVLSALAALLSRPALLEGEIAEVLSWRTAPDSQGPYRTLVEHIGRDGRRRLKTALQHLPTVIAVPAAAALADDADLGDGGLHKPLAFRDDYERGL